jgi:LuxR family transcriptional regulator, quorum-sensing system regulator CciR
VSRLSDVNEFILASRGSRSADDLRALLDPITREMHFHSYALFQHVKHFSWRKKKLLAISNFSRNWIDYFFAHKMTADDPVHLASHRTAVGFRFDEIPGLIHITERQKSVMEAGRKEGITDGFCVPIHIPGETNGTCTFIVREGTPLPVDNLPMAQLVGSFAYEAARQIQLSGGGILRRPDGQRLTTRQLECIVLIGRGKTDWEISRILGLHEQTVTQHLNEARNRCGVSRRTELVVHTLYHGDLTFSDILN